MEKDIEVKKDVEGLDAKLDLNAVDQKENKVVFADFTKRIYDYQMSTLSHFHKIFFAMVKNN